MMNVDSIEVGRTLDEIAASLERATSAILKLKTLLSGSEQPSEGFDPKDAANKYEIGGLEKLTERGIEICYRLFDAGKTRYAVAELMNISFGAANHRFKAWEKAGGINRLKAPL
nr:hypothetical protein [uncultured Shinella sp.]